MTDRWRRYFEDHGAFDRKWLQEASAHWSFHEVLYGNVQRHCPAPARILNVGCGPGWSDLYFSSTGYDVTGIDNEQSLVGYATAMGRRFDLPARFEHADAFNLSAYHDRFDLVYSCGVLEHFDRDVTVQLLVEQTRCAPRVLIEVPTRYTAYTGPITDERIYTIGQLKDIVRDAGMRIVTAFGYGDITMTRGQVWARRVLPRMVWRWLQNQGYAFGIAVIGERVGRP